MTILLDPEENEPQALFRLFDGFAGRSVLEIGCGDGRLTRRYAPRAGQVTAIDPDAKRLQRALADRSREFERVRFLNIGLEAFATRHRQKFDVAILAWSL